MRKKVLTASFLAISISASMGLTSYAGWVHDGHGWQYQYADGSTAKQGWLTDPDTGLIYHMAPGGYMMSDTEVEGYKLASDGHRLDKTDEQIARETREKEKKESRPSPNKAKMALDATVAEAKTRDYANSTLRSHYQAEMQVFMDKIFSDIANELYKDIKDRRAAAIEAAQEAAVAASMESEDGGDIGELSVDFSNLYPTDTYKANDNENVKYSIFRTEDNQDIIAASYSKIVKPESARYVPYTFELGYNRSIIASDEDLAAFDKGLQRLLVASLGQEQGGTIYDQIVTGAIADGTSGNTDSGNSFVIMKKNEVVTIRVTCSEKTSEEAEMTDETGENEGDAQTETSVENTETTSSVITSGQGQNQESEEDQNEEQAQEENENSEQAEE
ncbi:MAG: hypothetical protein HFG54_00685 [Lachnospiraceae bacterium]|jgi:hypothetical protein|nr:hypothetical protein [Lachnospiraceae bacterium]